MKDKVKDVDTHPGVKDKVKDVDTYLRVPRILHIADPTYHLIQIPPEDILLRKIIKPTCIT